MSNTIIEQLVAEKPNLMVESADSKMTGEEAYLHFYIDKKDVNYVNRILEGYEYVGVMTSVDNTGHQMIRCTSDTRSLAIEVLESLGNIVKSIEK